MKNRQITINSRKFDKSIHKSWTCEILEETSDYWLFVGEFQKEIIHSQLGIIRRGTISYEYYWTQKWFNVFRFHEPEGDLKFYYCNLNLPPNFKNSVLDYVDLDIDILVQKDLSFEVLDRDEFEINSKFYQYPTEIIERVEQTIAELVQMIEQKQFPFNQNLSQTL